MARGVPRSRAGTILWCCLGLLWICGVLNFWIYGGYSKYIFSCDMINNIPSTDKIVIYIIAYNSIIFLSGAYGLLCSDELALIMTSIAALTAMCMNIGEIITRVAPNESQRQQSFKNCIDSHALRPLEMKFKCCGLKTYKEYIKKNYTDVPVSCCGISRQCSVAILESLPGCETFFTSINLLIITKSIEIIFLAIIGVVSAIMSHVTKETADLFNN